VRTPLRALSISVAWLLGCGVAQADINVDVPPPGACPYPGVSDQGMVGTLVTTFWWSCDFPVEENGSTWHCYYYGAAGQGSLGISMMLQASMSGPVGGMKGGCHYDCPGGLRTKTPNPPSEWKYALRPKPCVPLDPPILDLPPPEPAPPDAQAPNFTVDPPEPSGITPAVTNPDQGNPDATVNPNP
jgi:hypothetical protein